MEVERKFICVALPCALREPISRYAGLHTKVACMIYGMLQNKLQEDLVHSIVKGAVEAERKFICEALPCDLRSRQFEEGG